MKEVRDSLSTSPINYTQRRNPHKISSTLEMQSEEQTPVGAMKS